MKKVFIGVFFLSISASVLAQSRSQTRPPTESVVLKNVVVSDRIERGISLSPDNMIKLFEPLATSNFSYKEAKIVEHEGQLYLVANYENRSTQEHQTIGISLIKENGKLVVNRTVKTVKCSKTNFYCTCIAPICSCVREGDGTGGTHVESCGEVVIEKDQITSFVNGIEATAR